jgi:murein DD-endopeptidase MepM/ murein hydrolase activator NlpD
MKLKKKYLRWLLAFVGSLILLFLILLYFQVFKEEEVIVPPPPPEPELRFGLPVDSFNVVEGIVMNNQNMGDILTRYGVDMGTIDRLVRSSRDTFDVRKIKVGQSYCIFQSKDAFRKALYFVYEKSDTDYVVFDLGDTLRAYIGRKDVEIKHKVVEGVINSSLWNSIDDLGVGISLAADMENIYAWTIDFFGIQKGDRFKVIYDEQSVEGKSVGTGPIYAAVFNVSGKERYAYRFYQIDKDHIGRFHYYDETGKNLEGAFLKAPLELFRISSRFTSSRYHPVLKIFRPHYGVDYAAPKGTPVRTIGNGTVIAKAFQAGGGGNYLKIKHNSAYTTSYMHLAGFAPGIHVGSQVNQKDVIGYVGATGLATGPHLDFRVYRNGVPIDPLKMESQPADPVSPENLASFNIMRDSMKIKLDKMKW